MFYEKYIKYKNKYDELLKQSGGTGPGAGPGGPMAGPGTGPSGPMAGPGTGPSGGLNQRPLALQSSDIRALRIAKEEEEIQKKKKLNARIREAVLNEQLIYQSKEKEEKIKEEMNSIVISKVKRKKIDVEDGLDYNENLILLKNIPQPPSVGPMASPSKIPVALQTSDIRGIRITDEKYYKTVSSKYKLSTGIFNKLEISPNDYCSKDQRLHINDNLISETEYDELFTNKLSGLDMINIFRLIYRMKEIFREVYPYIGDYKFLKNIRFHGGFFYKIPSIMTKPDNYIDKITDINLYISNNYPGISRQQNNDIKLVLSSQTGDKDNNHLIHDKVSLSIIEEMVKGKMYDSISFQELFLLEYSLKRLIQDKITEYILNYSVTVERRKYKIYKHNKIYSYFVLKTVKDIERKIKTQLLNGRNNIFRKLSGDITGTEEYKKFIIQQLVRTLDINIILKGGNLIKLLYNDNLDIDDAFFLRNYNEYYSDLSDYDFDIKIKFFNPLKLTPFYKDLRLCNSEYIEIYQIIKKYVMKFINNYFNNIKHNFNAIREKQYTFEQVEEALLCNINLFNKYIRYLSQVPENDKNDFFTQDELRIVNDDLFKYNFLNIENKNLKDNWKNTPECFGALDILTQNSCELYDAVYYKFLNCKDLPEGKTTKNSILSYISSQYIGSIDKTDRMEIQFFDLTRLCLRLKILNTDMKSKAECIDFGLFNFSKQTMEKGESKLLTYKFDLLGETIKFDGKNVKYLLSELIVLIFTAKTKRSKRLRRIFLILDKMIQLNYNIFEIIQNENKLMNNIFFKKIIDNYDENNFNLMSFNFIDSIIVLLHLNKDLIETNRNTLDNIDSFKLFWGIYQDLNIYLNATRVTPNTGNDRVSLIIKGFEFKTLLSIAEFRIIFRI